MQPQKLEVTAMPDTMDVTTTSQRDLEFHTRRHDTLRNDVTRVVLNDSLMTNNMSYSQHGVITAEGELIDGFLAAVCNDANSFDVLDQVAELEEILSLNIMSAKQNRDSLLELSALKQERNTWRLLGRLYHDELTQNQNLGQDLLNTALVSEKEVIQHAFVTDKKLRRAQVIVDWLEHNARKEVEELQIKVPAPSTTGWENTLAKLLGKIDTRSTDIVTNLDPDAPLRQKKNLHELDHRDEQEFAKLLYIYVRAGMLEAAQEICEQSGQPWRAATLDGWKLFHDPNLATNVSNAASEIHPTEGNLNRALWKRVALRMTQDTNVQRYERAAYSALCGNIQVLKSVCTTWEDVLWAYTKCLVDTVVENKIREGILLTRPLCDLPAFYWENKQSIEDVFHSVSAMQLNEDNMKEAKIFHEVQRLLILNEVKDLYDVLDKWSLQATINEREILRFFAHLIILLRRLNCHNKNVSKGLICIRRYCEYLMETHHIQQLAWYVSQLLDQDQIELYAQFLETLKHDADKRLALSLAVENGLPVADILSQVVKRIHSEPSLDDEEAEIKLISHKIEALDWLLYDPKQMDEAVERANLLIRNLKATNKDEAAKVAFDRLPENAVDTLTKYCVDDHEDLTASQNLILKEHLCWSTYFSAKAAFDRWFDHHNKEKPKCPDESKLTQHLTKQVTHEKQTIQYNIALEQWKATQNSLAKEANEKIMAVITFSDGWMAEPEDDVELIYLRKLCIPEVIFLLHTLLHTTENYDQAVALADIVASEVHGLYECFHKENMRIFLNKIKLSAVSQLENQ